MYDTWTDAAENGNMAGVMMVDLSAAFDMVDHDLLIQKLELMGLKADALSWFRSYLTNRSQTVCIDGTLARVLDVDCGVPQGSVLGPLLYVLFTNDLPEVVHSHDQPLTFLNPNMQCDGCGGLVNYVDDATYSYASDDPVELSGKLSETYKCIADYMVANKLVINADKTHLLVMGTQAMCEARQQVQLRAGEHIITPTPAEKLLGCNIHDVEWGEHIQNNEQSLIRQLTSRVNALYKLSVNATFKTRLMAANGAFMSVLMYLVPLWGGTEQYLLKGLQVLQNRAARCVTKQSWFTPTRQLLKQCGWMSVQQLAQYHSILQVHKVIKAGKPLYLSSKLVTDHPYPTRQASSGGIRHTADNTGLSSLAQKNVFGRAPKSYNSISTEIKTAVSIAVFKRKLRVWIHQNTPIA